MVVHDDLMLRVKEHERWRGEECLNLIPSENHTSPQVQHILASDMGRRYTLPFNQELHGSVVENAYRGTKYLDEIEILGEDLARKVFNAKHVCLKPLSGHVSGLMALISTCSRGDQILAINASQGGYDGYMAEYMPSFLGLKVDCLPFDESTWNLDVEACVDVITTKIPRAVVVGSSFILFPFDLKSLKNACAEVGASLLYDASHVLGLMPWNFQDALAEGTDLLYGSTHKTFFGPQGGIMLTNDDDVFENLQRNMNWKVLDNAHWNRIAALAQALIEYKRFGREYGAQVVRNSSAFAHALSNEGIPVKFETMGFTKSHMAYLDHEKLKSQYDLSTNEFSTKLEQSNIIIDSVGRIGVSELTRLDAKEDDMKYIARLVRKAIDTTVKDEVIETRKKLKLAFCF